MISGDEGSGLAGALKVLAERVLPERIDQLWLFPTVRVGERESGLIVASAVARDAERREIHTLRYEIVVERGRARRNDELAEQGTVPAERMPRVIEGVLRRMGDTSAEPRTVSIRCDSGRWLELLRQVGTSGDSA